MPQVELNKEYHTNNCLIFNRKLLEETKPIRFLKRYRLARPQVELNKEYHTNNCLIVYKMLIGDTDKITKSKNIKNIQKLLIMKYKMVVLLLLIQAAVITKTTAQFFGVSDGTLFTPVSTVDIRGTFGINLFKDTSSTSTSTAAAAIILNSTVLSSSLTGGGRTSLQIPAPGSSYLNRVYFIANTPSFSGGKAWDLQNGIFYYDLFNAKTYSVPLSAGVMIICNGTDWLQIN